MIIIRVELHSAITGKITEIARMLLWNDGSGSHRTGHYGGKVVGGRTDGPMIVPAIRTRKALRQGSVRDYPRLRLHVWNLVARMLTSMNFK